MGSLCRGICPFTSDQTVTSRLKGISPNEQVAPTQVEADMKKRRQETKNKIDKKQSKQHPDPSPRIQNHPTFMYATPKMSNHYENRQKQTIINSVSTPPLSRMSSNQQIIYCPSAPKPPISIIPLALPPQPQESNSKFRYEAKNNYIGNHQNNPRVKDPRSPFNQLKEQEKHQVTPNQGQRINKIPQNFSIKINENISRADRNSQCGIDKFTNSVNQNPHLEEEQINYTPQLTYQNHGLPNIGNTCYLNSIIQLLFSAQRLRQQIIIDAKIHQDWYFHYLLSQIFKAISLQVPEWKKRENLRKIMAFMQEKDENFVLYQQKDSIECFLCVMNLLESEDQSNSKLDFFAVEYQNRCACSGGKGSIFKNYFVNSSLTCIQCNQQIKFYVHKFGAYIIISSNCKEKDFKKEMQIKLIDGSKHFFENVAFITYYGNKASGHYISNIKLDNKWLEINDSNVKIIQDTKSMRYRPMITLFAYRKDWK